MQIPGKKPARLSTQFNPAQDRRIYNTLTMLGYLISLISPSTTWRTRLKNLIDSTPQLDVADMGFPEDWRQLRIWQEQTAS